MRLLERTAKGTYRLQDFRGKQVPAYAILSHTWDQDDSQEIRLEDVEMRPNSSKRGWDKLRFCLNRAKHDGLQWVWIDTCCIDKRDAVELSTAINSMFRWYENAARCYVYLTNVSSANESDSDWHSAFRSSRWHSRGWTLQELIAPTDLDFYSRESQHLGSRKSLVTMLVDITGVSAGALQGETLANFSVEEKEAWAITRTTTVEEDMVYSLLGIFDVTMPLIYGEGKERARRRLRHELLLNTTGESFCSARNAYSRYIRFWSCQAHSQRRKWLQQAHTSYGWQFDLLQLAQRNLR